MELRIADHSQAIIDAYWKAISDIRNSKVL
jgi:hypothetical protein